MNRRRFLTLLAAAAPAFALDPERLLWEPGKKTFFLPSPKLEWKEDWWEFVSIPSPTDFSSGYINDYTFGPGPHILRLDVLYGRGVVAAHKVGGPSGDGQPWFTTQKVELQTGVEFEWAKLNEGAFWPQQIKDCAQRMAEEIDRRCMASYEDIARRKS